MIVIDDKFAKLYFAGKDPIGKHVNFGILNMNAEIVGVVGHVKQWGLDTDATGPVQAQCYLPISQIPDSIFSLLEHRTGAVVRTSAAEPRWPRWVPSVTRCKG